MRILAFSDLHAHCHRAFATYDQGLNSRLRDALSVLDEVKDMAGGVDLILFGGDLFHLAPTPSIALNHVIERIGAISSITPVAMIVGNHDLQSKYYQGDLSHAPSFLLPLLDMAEVVLFDGEAKREFTSKDGSETVSVSGFHHRRLADTKRSLKEAEPADICLLHQDVLGASVGRFVFPAGVEHEETSKFGWTLCGHIHQPQKISDRFVILGAPLHINFSDSGDRGVWVLDTKDQSIEMVKTTFPRFVTVGKGEKAPEDGNFYREKEDEEKRKALVLPGVEDAIAEYVKTVKAPEAFAGVGVTLASGVSRDVPVPSDFALERVEIENFVVFERAELSVGHGLQLVVGECEGAEGRSNGSGKTSLFEAVSWALYGTTSKGETGTAVMRRGLKRGGKCRVEVTLTSPTKGTLLITRERTKSGVNLFASLGTYIEEGDSRVVQKWITETLGVGYEFFSQMVYYSQESVDFFSAMGDADRKRMLGSLLGLRWYEDACQVAKTKREAAIFLEAGAVKEEEAINRSIGETELRVERTQGQIEVWERERQSRVESFDHQVVQTRLEMEVNAMGAAERKAKDRVEMEIDLAALTGRITAEVGELEEEARTRLATLEEDLLSRRGKAEKELWDLESELESMLPPGKLQRRELKAHANFGRLQLKLQEEIGVHAGEGANQRATKSQIEDLDRKMKKIQDLDEGQCPICGAEVTLASKGRCVEEIWDQICRLNCVRKQQLEAEEAAARLMAGTQEEIDQAKAHLQGISAKGERHRETESKRDDAQRTVKALLEEQERALEEHERRVESRREALATEEISERRRIEEGLKLRLEKIDAEEEAKKEALNRIISSLLERLDQARDEKCPHEETLEGLSSDLSNQKETLVETECQRQSMAEAVRGFDFWVKGFGREGIPAALLREFCRVFTTEVNDILSQMNVGIAVALSPSKTLKSGEERDRLDYIIRTRTGESSYGMLSGGEKVRVDLMSMLALNTIASRQFNIQDGLFGVLVLDEVFSALDEEGCELVHELLSRFQARSVFVVSHSSHLKALFDGVIEVRKTGDTSVVV